MSKTVINKRSQIIWDNGFAPDGQSLPKVSTTDAGKVLTVDEEGKWSAGEASGGTEYTAGDNIQISADNVISATDTTYTAGDNVEISADNEISSVNTIVFNAKYFRATDTFQYDADAIAPFLTEVFKNDKRAIVRVQDGNYNIYDIYTLRHYESTNKAAAFVKVNPSIVSANQKEIGCANIALSVNNGVGTLTYTFAGVTALPSGASAGQVAVSDGHNGWVAGNIPSELPSVSSADEGKVLKVDSNGDWAVGTDDDTTYTAGTNVQINGDVISATDTKYTAGANITIDANNEISATDTTYSAGNGITITGTTIAADDQLPSVTSADEGKILTVDSNGDWVKGTAPSGAQDIVIVNLRRDTSNNALSITDTTYTTEQQIQTLVTDGKEVILRVQEDSTENFEFFTLGTDKAMGSQIGLMILWNSISVDNFATGLTHFSSIGLLMGTNFVYENMGVNLGGGETWELIGGDYDQLNNYAVDGNLGNYTIALDSGIDFTQYKRMVVEFYVANNDNVIASTGPDGYLKYNPIIITGEKNPNDSQVTGNTPAPFVFPVNMLTAVTTSAGSRYCSQTMMVLFFNSTGTALNLYMRAVNANQNIHVEARVKVYGIK